MKTNIKEWTGNTLKSEEKVQYAKCSKISYSKVANKMAYTNSADPDQTAPDGAV